MTQPPMQPMQQPPMVYAQPPQKSGMSTGCIVGIVIGVIAVIAIPIVAALAIYGVRRYLVASKSAEAKANVQAIARGATAAYEREHDMPDGTVSHGLCASSGPDAPDHQPVPAGSPPRGTKYMPDSSEGHDFNTGTDRGGWRCVKFSMTQPHYYQYHYNQGDDYAVSRPDDPGPDGFEAAAIGDLDADGDESEFSVVGRLSGDRVKTESQVYLKNEGE